jgi:hypothetical protein
MTLLFTTRTDSCFGTDSLYPDYVQELTFPKQMLARPEVPSWQRYNFAGSIKARRVEPAPSKLSSLAES